MSVLYLTDSSDTAKVNLALVVYASEEYTVYLTSPVCWVMTGNDYSNAQCLGYCTRSASKQARRCLFEFSILYCHVSLCCLEFTPCDGSFPSPPRPPPLGEEVAGSCSSSRWGTRVCCVEIMAPGVCDRCLISLQCRQHHPGVSATWEKQKPRRVYITSPRGVGTITGTCLRPWNAADPQGTLSIKRFGGFFLPLRI